MECTVILGRAAAIGLAMALVTAPVVAQDRPFSLPTASSSPRAQGPVDTDNPIVISTPRPEPSPTPAPVPTVTASAATPGPTASPSPAPPQSSTEPARPQAPRTRSTASAVSSPNPAPSAEAFPTPVASTEAAPVAEPAASIAPVEPSPTPWPLIGSLAAFLLALLSWWAWKRRAASGDEDSDGPEITIPASPPVPVAPQPEATPDLPAGPVLTAAPPPVSADAIPSPAFAAKDGNPLACALEAKRISATLINAQLDYRIELANNSRQTIELIVIHGDMIGAHASLGGGQMADGQDDLPVLHRVPRLAAGERTGLTGSIRLPLAQIQAVRQGSAALFVPLVRLRTRASGLDGSAIDLPQTLVIGEPPLSDGSGLRPFRLDMGPRIYNQVTALNVTTRS